MQSIVVLGTGGTIAGTGPDVGYRAAQLGVAGLLAALPVAPAGPFECEQVAQLDSKDMDHATWQRLAQRCAHHLARSEVAGVVVTHGTDTLEETALFLHRVLAPAKPLVLTGAMRPATSPEADGPRNLADALCVAREPGARGVLAVLGGQVFGAADVRKWHPHRIDAFDGGEAGALALIESGALRPLRPWPAARAAALERIAAAPADWPRVEIVTSHAGADAALVRGLLAQGVDGIVVAGTGNRTVNAALDAGLREAQAAGVRVVTATRCATPLTPAKARIALLLDLMGVPD